MMKPKFRVAVAGWSTVRSVYVWDALPGVGCFLIALEIAHASHPDCGPCRKRIEQVQPLLGIRPVEGHQYVITLDALGSGERVLSCSDFGSTAPTNQEAVSFISSLLGRHVQLI